MKGQSLSDTAQALFADDKGLLAIDESIHTCNRRFAALGISQTEEARRAYRELLITAPGLDDAISGVILCDETIRQKTSDGTPMITALLAAGITPGIKVDTGEIAMSGHPHEHITEGLDGLKARLDEYALLGARFSKWRAVIEIGEGLPTRACVEANAHGLARFAAVSQEAGLVPIVEPEVLIEGSHSLDRCRDVTELVLHEVFHQLFTQGVALDAMILKPGMVVPGLSCPQQHTVNEVAEATVKCLLRSVPAAVPAVAFLSGGQACELATARLTAMNVIFKATRPWALAFSFARAIQQPALELWRGEERNIVAAQQALVHRARCNWSARRGDYNSAMEQR